MNNKYLHTFIFIVFFSFVILVVFGGGGVAAAEESNSGNNSGKNRISSDINGKLPILPANIPFEIFLGRKLFSEGKYEEATRLFESAKDRGQASGKDVALLGISYYKLGKNDMASMVLEKAAKDYPTEPLVYVGLGYIAFSKKDFKVALGYFVRAKSLKPGMPEAVNGIVAAYINLGVESYSKGKIDDAEKYFNEALKEKPDSAGALSNIGILKLEAEEIGEAVRYFSQALKYKPNNVKILKFLAEALKKKEGLGGKEILLIATRLKEVNPNDPYTFELLGKIYEARKNEQKAYNAFDSAYKRGSEDPYVYYWLAKYRWKELKKGHGKTEKIVSLIYLSIGKAVQRIGAIQLGAAKQIEKKKGKLGKEDIKSLKEYSRLIDEPKLILNFSLQLLGAVRGNKGAFETDIDKLSSWYPHSVDIKVAYGRLFEEEGKWKKALSIWEELAEKHPYNLEAHLGIARAYERLGFWEKAVLECKKAVDIDDQNEEVYQFLIRLYERYRNDKKYSELISFLKDRFEINKYNVKLIKTMIKAYELAGQKGNAEAMKEWLEHVEGFKK